MSAIPKHWEIRRLKFMANIQNGRDYKEVESDEGFPVIGSGGQFTFASEFLYDGESVLFGRKGTIDKPLHINGKFWTVDTMFYSIISQDVFGRYLYYFSTIFQYEKLATQTALPSITQYDLGNYLLCYPYLNEQKAIANFLDHKTAQVDRLIEKKQEFIGKLQEMRRAFITHAVTSGIENGVTMKDPDIEWLGAIPAHWRTSKLKFESTIVDCKNRTPEYFPDGEYLVVRTSNVRNGELLTEPALHTDQENFEEWTKRGIPPAGSILFTREAPAGEVCLVPAEIKLCLGQRMMNFIIDDHAMTEFILYFLMSNKFQQYIEAESSGSTVTHLRVEQVHNIPVCLPESREAEKIVSKIKCIEGRCFSLIQHAEAAIARLQEYRTALITAAVTGQIDIRDWQAPAAAEASEQDKEVA
ncbi:restriction endonuclease subunit S [Pseudomonas sp. NPDC077186]|uniref:restriction endonuclease subunit S n=1 Tax=Pseudomonas sp. NPDC077186 TaxID=3364421 RepID=UPI0037C99751